MKIFRVSKLNLYNSFYFILLIFINSCNLKNENPGNKNSNKNITVKYDEVDQQLNFLSQAFNLHNKELITHHWDIILNNKNKYLDYLFTLKGNNQKSNWYWYDLGCHSFATREYTRKTVEISALFLISAIYYNDISFANSRSFYNNDSVFLLKNGKLLNKSNDIQYNNEIKEIWYLAELNRNKKNKRPFYGSNFYWVGEKGGKINLMNIQETKWSYYR